MTIGDIEPLLESAGELLKGYWVAAEAGRPGLEDHADEIREACERVQAVDPDNVTAAVGLCVLASATLRHHIEYISPVGAVLDEGDDPPFDSLEDVGDEEGRGLAHEAVHAARRALALDAANNLAAYELGYALEWLGRHGEARRRVPPGRRARSLRGSTPLGDWRALNGHRRARCREHGLDIGHSRCFYELEMDPRRLPQRRHGRLDVAAGGPGQLCARPPTATSTNGPAGNELIGREFSLRTHFPRTAGHRRGTARGDPPGTRRNLGTSTGPGRDHPRPRSKPCSRPASRFGSTGQCSSSAAMSMPAMSEARGRDCLRNPPNTVVAVGVDALQHVDHGRCG